MQTKLPKISIGIPAYNEEANIKNLLDSILSQKARNFGLLEIIIVSDGSTDATNALVESISDKRILLVQTKSRRGMTFAQNEIVARASGDVLVLLDADVLPESNLFLEEIVRPILEDEKVSLVGADTVPLSPKGFFESVIAYSHDFKTHIFRKINHADNVYLCHGRARALSRDLYKSIVWPVSLAEDAYCYLFAKERNYKFVYQDSAKVLFRCPATFSDHKIQSVRFSIGKKTLEGHFRRNFVQREFRINPFLIFGAAGKYFFKDPVRFICYFCILFFLKLGKKSDFQKNSHFEVAETSKILN